MSESFWTLPLELEWKIVTHLGLTDRARLVRVSKHFREVVEPRLYETIDINARHVTTLWDTNRKQLEDTDRNQPHIGEHIKMLKVDAPQERMKEERLSAAAALVQWLPHLSSLRLLNLDSTLSEEMLSTFDFSRFEALTTLKVPAELLVKFDTETQWPLAERLPSQLTELHVEEWWPLVESRDILPSMLLEYLRAKPAALRLISVVSDADYWTPREKVLQEQCDKRAVAFNLNFICAKYGEDRHEQ